MKVVEKAWGSETWLVNSELYCAKFLNISPQYRCSLHAHKVKDETFIVLNGGVILEQVDASGHKHEEILGYGDARHIAPGTYHRFGSIAGATILEVSTHHDDADVIRLEASSQIL